MLLSQEPRTGLRTSMPPRGSAPGLKVGRNNLKYWIARNVARDTMGFPDVCIPLPVEADDAAIAVLCHEHTARLRAWIEEQKKAEPSLTKTRYDGTVLSACRVYQEHPLSRFHAAKHNTQKTYQSSLRLIELTVGKRLIRNITVPDVQHWYDQWRKPAAPGADERIKRAHEATSMFRTVIYFLASLRYGECKQLADELQYVKF
jgi:hypothetical protein